MSDRQKLPLREHVFLSSLQYHGFKRVRSKKHLKLRRGYVIAATRREDAVGIDFWVKMPKDHRVFPVQVTQRGIFLYRMHNRHVPDRFSEFLAYSEQRIQEKRKRCKRHKIAFVLVRDYSGTVTTPQIARGDVKALRFAIAHLKRWL